MVYGHVSSVTASKNPYSFDYSIYLQRKNIFKQIHLPSVIQALPDKKDVFYYVIQWRDKILNSFEIHFYSKEVEGLVAGLLFGVRTGLSPEIEQQYRMAGVMHVLAISGLHVGVIFWVLKYVLYYPVPNKKLKYAVTVSIMILFAFLSGLSGSIVRAVIMFSIFGYAQLINRQADTLHLMFVAMFLMLAGHPQFVFDIGFQLSYLAVFAIIWFQPFLKCYFWHRNIMLRFVMEMVGVSLVAQLGVLPLTLYYFGQMPLLFLLGNIIAVPVTSLVLILLLLMIPLNFWMPDFAILTGKSVSMLIECCNAAMAWIAGFESLVIHNVKLTIGQCVLALFAIFFLGNGFRTKDKKNLICALSVFCVLQCSIILEKWNLRKQNELIVFNDYQHIAVLRHRGFQALLFTTDTTFTEKNYVNDFVRYNRIDSIQKIPVKDFIVSDSRIALVGHSGIYVKEPFTDLLILTENPKINLERLINHLKPKQIIAHSKNARWRVALWKSTCIKNNIPFHDMHEKGYYSIRR